MADRRVLLPAVDFPDMRLGRHVNHDPESLRYRVTAPAARVTPRSQKWTRHVGPFDQGNLGSCTINAKLGALATDPFWSTLPADLQRRLGGADIQNDLVIPLYREETALDPFPGSYEPDDTGSDGLSAAKVAKAHGWISGYQHATDLTGCHTAIQSGPFIIGIPWYQGMFTPDPNGVVTPSGAVAGGHEVVVDEYDLSRDLWWFTNSWTAGWGVRGRGAMTSATLQSLLSQQGDATSFVPLTSAPPKPSDPPKPVADFPYVAMDSWAAKKSSAWPKYQRDAAAAYAAWRAKR